MKEMQELIEAAEQYRNWHEDLPVIGYFNEIRSRLITAISAARKASEGGWIEKVQDEVRLAEHKIDQYLQGEGPGTVRLGVALQACRRALLLLPAPPLSVETPEVKK